MRIAVVADDLYPGFGGQAAATEGHVEALLARGHEVRALAGVERVPSEPPSGVSVGRLPVWRPGEKQTHLALPDSGKIRDLLDWADVVQINTPTPLALRTLQLARRMDVPSVMGFHTQEESAALHFFLMRRPVKAALRRWYTALYRRPDCLVAPTAFAARLASSYTPRPIHAVSNGIRLSRVDAAGEERASALRGRLLSGGRFLISHVGRLTHEKRPQDLVSFAEKLAHRRRDWRLIIAGTGPLRRSLEQRTAKLGLADRVQFLGYVPEEVKEDLLMASDLFLMPSPTELQSIATLEAMVRRCAVVAADFETSAVGEMVRESGCGICYRPERLDVAVADVSRLLDQPEELRLLQRNAAEAARRHDVHLSGKRLEEIYASQLRIRGGDPEPTEGPLERMEA
ncbi:MAG TPA: glycosyltransferase [Rubrobacteraceae bacterium]|nr:glycosyltransferase [Rubrobacteraceae bacterium]